MKNLCLLLFLTFLFGCDIKRGKRENRDSLHFGTPEDAELFFKNIRRLDYDYENLVAAKLDIFRHEERSQAVDYPLMTPAVVLNWRFNEAYLILEANERVGQARPLILEWQGKTAQQKGRYVLESNNKMEQLRFADKLYQGLRQGQQFFLVSDSTRQPFLDKPNDRRVFRTTMSDYYQLTGTRR